MTAYGISDVISIDNLPAIQTITGSVNVSTTGSRGLQVGNAQYSPLFVTGSVAASLFPTFRSPCTDTFGRLRVSELSTLIETVHQYDNSPMFWDVTIGGSSSITHVTNQSAALLTVNTASTDSVKFQTHGYARYVPGKTQVIYLTGILGAQTNNVVKRAGYFDRENGLFFEVSGTDVAVVRRTSTSGSPIDNRVTQSSWNLDTFDGTGSPSNPSGILLDTTKMQLMIIDFEWLSTGTVRFGFDIAGFTIYCHVMKHSNVLSVPFMSTANLPVRYELTNVGTTSGPNTLLAVCSTVASEGGSVSVTGLTGGAITSVTVPKGVAVAQVPLISLRPSLLFQGVTNRGTVEVSAIDVISDQSIACQMWLNPTLTSSSFAPYDVTNSIVDIDTSATSMSNGYCLASFLTQGGTTRTLDVSTLNLSKKMLALNATGSVGDIITITASKITTNATNVQAALNWAEHR